MTLTLICGLPNAGKTTYSAQFGNVIHLDDYFRDFDACNSMASQASEDVCIEGIYNTKKKRKDLLECINKDYKKVCIWLNTSTEECIKRENRNRSKHLILSCAKQLEPPTEDEGWDEIQII